MFRFTSSFKAELPVAAVIAIDGKDMDKMLIRPDELYEEEGHVSMGPISNTEGEWKLQRYRFATLDTSESSLPFQGVNRELIVIQARMFPMNR